MKRFIHQHLISILHPISEHFMDMKQRQDKLAEMINQVDGKVDRSSQRADRQDREVAQLEERLVQTGSDLAALRFEMKDWDYEGRITRLEADYRGLKEGLAEAETHKEIMDSTVQALRAAIEESDANAHKLQLKLWQTTNLSERTESAMAQLKEECLGVRDRVLGMVRTVQQNQQDITSMRANATKWSSALDDHQKEVFKGLTACRQRVVNVEAGLAENSAMVRATDKVVATTLRDCKQVMGSLTEVQQELEGLSDFLTDKDPNKSVGANLLERISKVEADNARTARTLAAEQERNMPGLFKDLAGAVRRNSEDIKRVVTDVRELESFRKDFGNQIQKLSEQAEDVGHKQGVLTDRTNIVETQVAELAGVQKDTDLKVDSHRAELQRALQDMRRTKNDLAQTQAIVTDLGGDLGTTSDGLAKTAMRVDLAHEYLEGLSGGFQETHRRVLSGQDCMLPPKSFTVAKMQRLPDVPSPRRPASAVRPRRPTPRDDAFVPIYASNP